MDTEEPVPMANIPALGRDITIGYLYDIRTDRIINRSFWNEDVRKSVTEVSKKTTDFKVAVSDTFEQRSKLMDISAEVSLTLYGTAKLAGSAHYLNARSSSTKTSSVTLKLRTTDRYERLNENQLSEISYSKNLDIKQATHVISHITYGNDAYFKFEKQMEKGQSKDEVQGALDVSVQMGIGKISGKGEVDTNTQGETDKTSIKCEFNGDFALTTIPTTFESAMKVLEEILSEKHKNERTAVPISFSLIPLYQLDSNASRSVRSISHAAVEKATMLKNYQERCLQELDDLLTSEIFRDNHYGEVRKFISEVRRLFSGNDSKYKQKLMDILPKIKGNELNEQSKSRVSENDLLKLVSEFEESSFGEAKFRQWYDVMKEEIVFLEEIMNKLNTFQNTSTKIRVCESKAIERKVRLKHGHRNGWYALNMDLMSCLNQQLITHLEKELKNPEIQDIDEYHMSPSFLSDDGDFVETLSEKMEKLQQLAILQDNQENENLCFAAVINYPATDNNNVTIDFEAGRKLKNMDVSLDLELYMKKISLDEEGHYSFSISNSPDSTEEVTKYPGISVEFQHRNIADDGFESPKTCSVIDVKRKEALISSIIPSSNMYYLGRARAKYIGGAVGPWIDFKAFCCVTFDCIKYVPTKHAIIININQANTSQNENTSKGENEKEQIFRGSPFKVEFEYRKIETDGESFSSLISTTEDGKCFEVKLPKDDKGKIEYRCRYIVNKIYNLEPYAWMDGEWTGDWSVPQTISAGKIIFYSCSEITQINFGNIYYTISLIFCTYLENTNFRACAQAFEEINRGQGTRKNSEV